MWSIQNGQMILDISKIRDDFRIVNENGLFLVCPKKNMWDWAEKEKWLRSIVVNEQGQVVSCAWPKFGNYGEFLIDTKIFEEALYKNENVIFTHKEDGSLCIRSVINGEVIFRTRGTLFGGYAPDEEITFADRFTAVAKEKYPILLDPNFYPNSSLLFEYVGPNNTIVVFYEQEDLIFIGKIEHQNLYINSWNDLKNIADKYKLNLVKNYILPKNIKDILKTIEGWKEEGVVVRCNNSQTLVKIKSAHYLAGHKMKFSMNYTSMVEFIEGSGVKNEKELEEELKKCDYDWEIIQMAKMYYQRYCEAICRVNKIKNKAKEIVENFNKLWKIPNEKEKRKAFAELVKKQDGLIRPIAFCLYDNKTERLNELLRKAVISETK